MNETYFKVIDSSEKAYLLGFLCADGTVRKTNFEITQSTKNEYIVDHFIRCLNLENTKKYINIKEKYFAVQIRVCSKNLVKDLNSHGFLGKKKDRLSLPNLEDSLYSPFLLGYYDGDGDTVGSAVAGANKHFLKDIKKKFSISYSVRLKTNKVTGWECHVLSIGIELRRNILKTYLGSMPQKRIIRYGGYENGNYAVKESKEKILKPVGNCLNCTNLISYKSKTSLCVRCYNSSGNRSTNGFKNSKRKVQDRPSLEQLNKDLENSSFVQVGKKYGVSDNSIRKWMKSKKA